VPRGLPSAAQKVADARHSRRWRPCQVRVDVQSAPHAPEKLALAPFPFPYDHRVRRLPPAPVGDVHRGHCPPVTRGEPGRRRGDARRVWARREPANFVLPEPFDHPGRVLAVHGKHQFGFRHPAHSHGAPAHSGKGDSQGVVVCRAHDTGRDPHAVGHALRRRVPFPPRAVVPLLRSHEPPRDSVPVYAGHAKRHDDLRRDLAAPAQRAKVARGRRAQDRSASETFAHQRGRL